MEFKRKFRDFFSQNKSIAEAARYKSRAAKNIEKEYGFQSSYPEDVKYVKKVQKFADEFEKYSPTKQLVDFDEEEQEGENDLDATIPETEIVYGKKIKYMQQEPIDLLESRAGREQFAKAADKTD